jgi:hypothetical protein
MTGFWKTTRFCRLRYLAEAKLKALVGCRFSC